MSISYFVDAVLDAPYNEKNVKKIFERGSKLGLIYYKKYEDQDTDCLQILTANEASIKITLLVNNAEELWNAYFNAKFEEVNFDLRLEPSRDGQSIRIAIDCGISFGRYYDLGSSSGPVIDFARVIRLVIALCKDFSILQLETTTM